MFRFISSIFAVPTLFITIFTGCKIPELEYGENSPDNFYFIGDSNHDYDGDGVTERDGDCDDRVAVMYPGAPELCDGLDNDCDRETDEVEDNAEVLVWWGDNDGDGYGSSAYEQIGCYQPDGFVLAGELADSDCNDSNGAVNPAATETCTAYDDDCDGMVNEADDSFSSEDVVWYLDADNDGRGTPETTITGCDQPAGYSPVADDCDDTNPNVFAGHAELCDGVDNDCNGEIDEGDEMEGEASWYADGDTDGYGDPAAVVTDCAQPEGYVANSDDCDDTDLAVNPEGTELCDDVDNNCSGLVDDGGVKLVFYRDADGDGFGDLAAWSEACEVISGWVVDNTDCDDSESSVNPAGVELCDGVNNDCDDFTDEADAEDVTTWYSDSDGDGFGDSTRPWEACERPSGYADNADDCDDSLNYVNPDGTETCANVYDDDCDGSNNDVGAEGCSEWFQDGDGDGYGDAESACICWADETTGHTVRNSEDCDDSTALINPDQPENCDTDHDDDCDGDSNDYGAANCSYFYMNQDGDAFGVDDSICVCEPIGDYNATESGDCDDENPLASPDHTETCATRFDDDCNELSDGSDSADATTWYRDVDGDSYGDEASSLLRCDMPEGYQAEGGDCDDARAEVNPSASETCTTTFDDDCDGDDNDPDADRCTTFYQDGDDDGYGVDSSQCLCTEEGDYRTTRAGDCDDGNPLASPSYAEDCTTTFDDDCDGDNNDLNATNCDTWFYDWDGDGYGIADYQCVCDTTDPYTATGMGDCNDTDATINSGALNCGYMGDVTAADAAAVSVGHSGDGDYCRGQGDAGDVNNDGFDDLLIGDCRGDIVGESGTYADGGASYLFLGSAEPEGTLTFGAGTNADSVIRAFDGGNRLGYTVSVGDVNGDSYADLLTSTVTDRAFVVFGPTSGDYGVANTSTADDPDLEFEGARFRWVGDINGDGQGDAILAPYYGYSGTANLLLGPIDESTSSSWPFGFDSYSKFGNDSFAAGDFSGDGLNDLAWINHYIFKIATDFSSIGTPGFEQYLTGANYNYSSTSAINDINGDGVGDLAVTHYGKSYTDTYLGTISNAGVVYILFGPISDHASGSALDSAANVIIFGDSNRDRLGYDIAAPDIDGDAVSDLTITNGSSNEPPLLYYGPLTNGGTLSPDNADGWFNHQQTSNQQTHSAGDLNNDGYEDFLIGGANTSRPIYLYLGQPN